MLSGTLPSLIVLLFRVAPALVVLSMGLKVAFLVVQLGSVWLIFYWVTGSIPDPLVDSIGFPVESSIYALLGAGCLFFSSLLGLASRYIALKATFSLERSLLSIREPEGLRLLPGDLKNIVKVILSLIDITVPMLLIVSVVVCWALVLPYSLAAVIVLLFVGCYAIRGGIRHSAVKYRQPKSRVTVAEYLKSQEHVSFYRILLLPSYISTVIFAVISISIVLSVIIARHFFDGGTWYTDLLIIATAITFLQMRSFAGIIQRVGAYKISLGKINKLLSQKTKASLS